MATKRLSGAAAALAPSARMKSLSGRLALAFTIFGLLPALVIVVTLYLQASAFQGAFATKAA